MSMVYINKVYFITLKMKNIVKLKYGKKTIKRKQF